MAKRTSKRELRGIATRTLRQTSSTRIVQVQIGKPEQHKNKKEWACEFQIVGLGEDRIRSARGVDSLQALILALEGIWHSLERSGRSLTWIGGEEGDHGVPRAVPTFFGRQFAVRIGKFVDKEIAKFGRSKRKRAR